MTENKKHRKLFSKKEYLFNLFSLLIVIFIGIYFGARSLYYYSKQSEATEGNNQSLEQIIVNNNKIVSKGTGLNRDKKGYYFKGKVTNNYVSFANRLFRVVRINNDGSIKIVSDDNSSTFMWGDSSSYRKSNVYNWLEKTENSNSGIYYDTIPKIDSFLVKTKYREDVLESDEVKPSKKSYSDYITTLTITDYIDASGKNSYLNNGEVFHLVGLNGNKGNLYVEEDGSIQEGDNLTGYGIRPVITLNKKIISSYGNGTIDNPYTIHQGKDTNYINTYVRLGNDLWKVYASKDNILKLVKKDYIKTNNKDMLHKFSANSEIFDIEDKDNIANYLNNDYLNSISYKKLLLDTDFYIGEIGIEKGYSWENIYKEKVKCKIGLLNIFDYVPDSYDDYFNLTTLEGNMKYVSYKKGLLEEIEISEEKHILPVVAIDKKSIIKGKGTKDNPYLTE